MFALSIVLTALLSGLIGYALGLRNGAKYVINNMLMGMLPPPTSEGIFPDDMTNEDTRGNC